VNEVRLPPLEYWPIDRLVPYERNPRKHTDAQVAELAALILEFGFCVPILVDSNEGIICGHGRLLAARLLGLAEVPVIYCGHLTPAQVRAFRLADNRIAEKAGWIQEYAADELRALKEDGYELELTAFETDEIERLLAGAGGDAGGPEQPDMTGNRVVFRISCEQLDANQFEILLERAVADSGLANVKLTRI
jgi:ParB-like chromosome segregation protein Spo0J